MVRILAFALALLVPIVASAQIIPTIVPCSGTNCSLCNLVQLAQNIINAGIYISIFLSAVFFAYAGWLYVSSGFEKVGDINQAKSIFWNVTIGLVIILAAWLVVDTIVRGLVEEKYLPWAALCR
jgi:hypothetical protein